MKILNLYAGIGGNRKLWGDEHEITAVEYDEEIAGIYKHFFPNDNVIIADAHEFILDNHRDFDFIWSSPPCPTHSRFNHLLQNIPEKYEKKYPEMELYQEIIYLKHFFKGHWVIENVISYYDPLIEPQKSNNHYFWANFTIPIFEKDNRGIRGNKNNLKYKQERNGFFVEDFPISSMKKRKILNNCVLPELGKAILDEVSGQRIQEASKN